MPIYTYQNIETGEISDHFMHIADLDAFARDNPKLKKIISTFSIGDTVRMGMKKPDQSFRELLKHIHNRTGGNHHYHHN